MKEYMFKELDDSEFGWDVDMDSFLPQKIKRSRHDEYTELSDQREDGDENLVAYSAGNSLGSEYLNHL